ncbi:hypothetical protein B484DRAFT_48243 [Ochromonadaceae sp. CCMP2298]|nr:hypothetical protein B484DRAFT_48243 [Ochromonadaceae sp. CCMP2298]
MSIRCFQRFFFLSISILYVSRSRAMTTKATDLGLREWHAMVAKIPKADIVPLGFGSATDTANKMAFLGDKILNAKIARTIWALEDDQSIEQLTNVQSFVHSNDFYADNLKSILPAHVDENIEALAAEQKHNAGTIVEAAVVAVDSLDQSGPTADRAIANLADWLTNTAIQRMAESNTESSNFKGNLLVTGGTVDSKPMPGYPAHAPRFTATATMGGASCEAEGPSKKESEQSASRQLLESVGVDLNGFERAGVERLAPVSVQHASSGWEISRYGNVERDYAMNLKNNECPYEWWVRKAQSRDSCHRMRMAPSIFKFVERVDLWQSFTCDNPLAPQTHALVAVQLRTSTTGKLYDKSFTATGTSKRNAQHHVACQVNAYILDIAQGESESGELRELVRDRE